MMLTEVGKTEVVANSFPCLFTAHCVTAACRELKSACKHKSAALISSRSPQAGARITFKTCKCPSVHSRTLQNSVCERQNSASATVTAQKKDPFRYQTVEIIFTRSHAKFIGRGFFQA